MAPPDKASAEQKEFLYKLMSEFLEQQKKGKLHKFWVTLYGEWFREWEIVEDMTIVDVTERKEALGAAIHEKKAYLRRWYHNHSKPKRVVAFGRLVKKTQKGQKTKRRPQLTEVYCRLFYKDRILHHVEAEVQRLTTLNGTRPTRGMKLRLVRNYAIALLELEPPEIKDKVEAEYERHKQEVEEIQKETTTTPQAYTEAIQTIGAHFDAFSQVLGDLTGWKFTLLAGGPDPTNGGRIRTAAVHYGENHAGLSFGEAMPDARNAAGAAFGSFLRSVYTPSECAARSIYPEDAVQGVASMSVPSDHPTGPPAAPAVHLPPPLPVGDANLLAALPHLGATPDEPALDLTGQGLNDFDPLDIDWDSLHLFDPRALEELGAGMLGSSTSLSLTDELATPLQDHVLHGFGFGMSNNNATMPFGTTISGQAASIITPIQPAALNAEGPVDNTANSPQPTDTQNAHVQLGAATPHSSSPPSTSTPPPLLPLTPSEAPLTHDGPSTVDHTTGSDAATGPPAVDDATNSDAAATAPSASLTGTILSQSKAMNAPLGKNKRTRDPIDAALIVPGKRSRKAKDRADAEVELSKPRGKENRPPRR